MSKYLTLVLGTLVFVFSVLISSGASNLFVSRSQLAAPAALSTTPTLSIKTDSTGHQFVANRLLLKFKPGFPANHQTEVLNAHQVTIQSEIPQIGVKVLQLPANVDEQALASLLSKNPNVEFVELDQVAKPALIPNDPKYAYVYQPEWHLPKISAPQAWDLTTGSPNVTIAILDSGVYGAHEDLVSKIVPGWNIYDNNSDTGDVVGHGTLVAGQAGAASNNSIGVAAPCWGCKLMPVRVSDSNGLGLGSIIASGLTWAADHGARVANLSFEYIDSAVISSAASYFNQKNGVVIFAAGNSDTFNPVSDDPNILVVSATDLNDLVPPWSVTGNCIDVAAPGVNIVTTLVSGGYGAGTGSSASAPIVSGVVGLMLSANPSLTPQQIDTILKQSADKVGGTISHTNADGTTTNCAYNTAGWSPCYGYGRINAYQAVQLAKGITPPPPDTIPPTVAISAPTGGTTVSGTITVTVTATDNTAVQAVSLKIDGSTLATDTTAPYSFSWDTTTATNGSHTLTAIATDSANNQAQSQVTLTVNNQTACLENWTCSSWSLCSTGGTQTRTCSDTNACGTTNTKPLEFQTCTPPPPPPDTTAPIVNITQPLANSKLPAKGSFTIAASASDPESEVSTIKLFFDSSLKATCLQSDSCSVSLPLGGKTKITTGTHQITATATNGAGLSSTAMIGVVK